VRARRIDDLSAIKMARDIAPPGRSTSATRCHQGPVAVRGAALSSPSNQMGKSNTPAELATVTATDGLILPALYYQRAMLAMRLNPQTPRHLAPRDGSGGIFCAVDRTNALMLTITNSGTAFLGLQNRGGGVLLQGVRISTRQAKVKRLQGTSTSSSPNAFHDIDGALTFTRKNTATPSCLVAALRGPGKVALCGHLKPKTLFRLRNLRRGGDDSGLSYEIMGRIASAALAEAKRQMAVGHGAGHGAFDMMDDYFSYQLCSTFFAVPTRRL